MASPPHEPEPAQRTPSQQPAEQQHQQQSQQSAPSSSAPSSAERTPPPPPVPSSDPRVFDDADPSTPDEHDLFKLSALDALKLLSTSVELLVRMTGDIPPTPPPKTPTNPQMSDMQAEKDKIVRSHSEKNLARLREQHQQQAAAAARDAVAKGVACGDAPEKNAEGQGHGLNKLQAYSASMSAQLRVQAQHQTPTTPSGSSQEIDGVHLRQRSTSPSSSSPQPYIIVGADSQPLNLQHGAITRKFYSKKEPPITINQYLMRLHQFCPMSTAVYLATSLYIHRLAVEERAIPVTRRNAHRLVLAGLRVAMKALEDMSYPHNKMAKVGGVSEAELARLEISFCFLAGFELVVGERPLRQHWEALRDGRAQQMLRGTDVPTLRLGRRPREITPAGG
ncbi:hypothetical protein PLIIFM63780_005120 [Purpureocillium lilacinum]|uniref:Cyclin-dependent protein kinase complex component (Pcl8) n=1 Tax=Purpureocillium lilacinum TaxID=33203 RepID=A0A2U3E6S9_PURLI|nr:hypothetical protein Purlil1_10005 [Purpureocillium lilacinum]PWI70187.1 cyclin-dependent protein kinase complex component (Pcl8) [Purpureocillium lilacinum]GJN67677.1 hypothetical protein PLICBS_001705 [Purpureocillium lilacinum]GJN81585.1 hypothetical protein PLIIFM63780_005120 [Purpureocillium lilacinum]